MNNNGTSALSSSSAASSIAATASASTTSAKPRSPRTSDGFLNITVGPTVWGAHDDKHNYTCDGNAYAVTRSCCASLGGFTDVASFNCNAECCDAFGQTVPTCPYGEYKYPFCVLPPHLHSSDWLACYHRVSREQGVGFIQSGCTRSRGAASVGASVGARVVSVPLGVLLLAASVALGVLSL